MTSDNWLFIVMLVIFALTVYGIATNKTTPEERDAMLKEDLW